MKTIIQHLQNADKPQTMPSIAYAYSRFGLIRMALERNRAEKDPNNP
ncbi:MAG: hypothetical protein ACLFOY_18965 [Desulfatibacillaceae bacterium]